MGDDPLAAWGPTGEDDQPLPRVTTPPGEEATPPEPEEGEGASRLRSTLPGGTTPPPRGVKRLLKGADRSTRDSQSSSDEGIPTGGTPPGLKKPKRVDPEQREQLTAMLSGLLNLVGMGLTLLAGRRQSPGRPPKDMVPTDAEAKAMATPLANIALRHSPDELGEATDLVDGVEFVAAAGMYATRAQTGAPGGATEQAARAAAQAQGAPGAPPVP